RLTLGGELSGEGGVRKSCQGDLRLDGSNSYEGGTVVDAGTLVGHAGAFGSCAIVNHAALVIDQSTDAPMALTISGESRFAKTGDAALTLAGKVSMSGVAQVEGGSLQLGEEGATTGSITGARGANGAFGFFGGANGKAGATGVTLDGGATGTTNYGRFAGGQ